MGERHIKYPEEAKRDARCRALRALEAREAERRRRKGKK